MRGELFNELRRCHCDQVPLQLVGNFLFCLLEGEREGGGGRSATVIMKSYKTTRNNCYNVYKLTTWVM